MTENVRLLLGDWTALSERAYPIRYDVFVLEQGVPEDMELDEFDAQSVHVLVELDAPIATAIATGRLIAQEGEYFSGLVGRIGRLAVRQKYRNLGLGQQMLTALIQAGVSRGLTNFELHAQLTARALYERLGFLAQGCVFKEAGIDHVLMVRGN